MSNSESFIDEVTEEVRRDRLFALMRRYGWIGILMVLAIVGGAAVREYRIEQHRTEAEAFGDAVSTALDQNDASQRRAALAAVPASGQRAAVLGLLLASDPQTDRVATLAALEKVAADGSLPSTYRDLALLRRVIVAGADLSVADRRAMLDSIAVPGRPFRTLAVEQSAMLSVEAGDVDAAIKTLDALRQDQESTPGLRRRAEQVIVALGGTPATQ